MDRRGAVDAIVHVVGTEQRVEADSSGRFVVSGLAPGSAQLRALAVGCDSASITLELRAGQTVTWNPVLRMQPWYARYLEHQKQYQRDILRADSAQRAAGTVDLIASKEVRTDTASAFTYARFGTRLLAAAARHVSAESSIVLSPLSAGQALAMLLGATEDSTSLAIRSALGLNALSDSGLAARSRTFNAVTLSRTDVQLRVANALWVDTSATMQRPFQRWAAEYFSAASRTLPLTSSSVVPIINRWADSVTRGAIPTILQRAFADSTILVLMNAVYFKGDWLHPFDSASTAERTFTNALGEAVPSRMMERTGGFAYTKNEHYAIARFPYREGLTAMYVLLPDSGVDPRAILAGMERTGWPLPDPRNGSTKVQVRLPLLHLDRVTDLRAPFVDLGMGILFDSTRADLGRLIVAGSGRPRLCPPRSAPRSITPCTRLRVSDAFQRTRLDVEERGTRAAAITVMMAEVVPTGVGVTPPTPEFFADRPFLFVLRDERTGTFLFVGLVLDPRK